MKTRVLTSTDVAHVIGAVGLDGFYDELIESMTRAFSVYDPAVTVARTRDGFHYREPDLGLLEWMPTMHLGSTACVKTVGYHPKNPVRRGLPSVMSTTALYDTTSGEMIALAESTLLTALRTGVASAIASDVPAADRPLLVGVIGCGAQAVTQLHALSRVRRIEEVLAFDIDASVAATLEQRLGRAVRVSVIDENRRQILLREVDLLVKTFLERSAVFADNIEQCVAEGECQQIEASAIVASLPDLVRDAEQFGCYRDVATVFDSTGWALEDHVVLELLLRHACRLDIGFSLELSNKPTDPYDP